MLNTLLNIRCGIKSGYSPSNLLKQNPCSKFKHSFFHIQSSVAGGFTEKVCFKE